VDAPPQRSFATPAPRSATSMNPLCLHCSDSPRPRLTPAPPLSTPNPSVGAGNPCLPSCLLLGVAVAPLPVLFAAAAATPYVCRVRVRVH
jgi:hypothetical protein